MCGEYYFDQPKAKAKGQRTRTEAGEVQGSGVRKNLDRHGSPAGKVQSPCGCWYFRNRFIDRMSEERENLAVSWQFIYSSLESRKPRTYAEINSSLRAVLDRMGPPRRSLQDFLLEAEAEDMRMYGRKLTLREKLDRLKKRSDDS